MRLIDADELIDYFYYGIDDKPIIDGISDRKISDNNKNQPTAYDVDNIVQEFEKIRAKKTCNKEKCDTKEICRICVVDDAIEIVKQCGVSDYVCEWKLEDEEANVYDTSCRNPHILIEGTPKENNYEYCPYCGKKIKESD